VTSGSVKREIAGRIRMREKNFQLMIWKWEVSEKGKMCLFESYYMPMMMLK
jgi:hypothetical protein